MALADHPEIGAETKRRVRSVSKQLGYRPRRKAKVSGPSRPARFGYVQVGGRTDDLMRAGLLRALTRTISQLGGRLEISESESVEDPAAVTQHVQAFAEGLDAVMLSGRVVPATVRDVSHSGPACLVVGHVMGVRGVGDSLPGHLIDYDNIEAGYVATQQLIEAGHCRVGFTCEAIPEGLLAWRWLRGYKLAHLDAGLPVDPALIQVSGRLFSGATESVQVYRTMDDPPTAHVVPDVRIASSLIQAYAAHKVEIGPERLVIGGATPTAQLFHVEHYPRIGWEHEAAAEAIIERLLELHRHSLRPPAVLLIPFTCHNLLKLKAPNAPLTTFTRPS